jgi:epoxide hydrolase 4
MPRSQPEARVNQLIPTSATTSMPHEAFPLPPGASEGYADVNGTRLHYVTAGASGPLVVLLHGFPEFWYSWRHQIPALAEHFRVVAPDLRGYNLSDKPARGYDIRSLCGDVAGLIEAFGERAAHVVGHDWGGGIAWAFAIREPERTRRLAIVNAPHPALMQCELRHPRQLLRSWYIFAFQLPRVPEWAVARRDYAALRTLFEDVNRASGTGDVFTEEDIARYVAAMARPGAPTAAINYYRALLRGGPGALGPLRRIEAPTLVLWGERDFALGTELLDGLDAWVRDLRVRRFPDAGHWLNQERPAEATQSLVAFLSEGH